MDIRCVLSLHGSAICCLLEISVSGVSIRVFHEIKSLPLVYTLKIRGICMVADFVGMAMPGLHLQ